MKFFYTIQKLLAFELKLIKISIYDFIFSHVSLQIFCVPQKLFLTFSSFF